MEQLEAVQLSRSEQTLIYAAKRLHSRGWPRFTGFELAKEVQEYHDERKIMSATTLSYGLTTLSEQQIITVVETGDRDYNPHIKRYRIREMEWRV